MSDQEVVLQEFDSTEISEMQRYIATNVSSSELTKLYTLTENVEDKSIIYVTAFRILESCMHYASTSDLRDKMGILLNESRKVYYALYPLIMRFNNPDLEFGKGRLKKQIIQIFIDNNPKINKLIDAFLIFGEKIEMINLDSVVGLDLESDYGQDILKEVRKVADSDSV